MDRIEANGAADVSLFYAEVEARVLAWTTKRKPTDASTHWSLRKLAAELGSAILHTTVASVCAEHNREPASA